MPFSCSCSRRLCPRPASQEPESETIYNPLKLPLGWDGKPIPYWCVPQLIRRALKGRLD